MHNKNPKAVIGSPPRKYLEFELAYRSDIPPEAPASENNEVLAIVYAKSDQGSAPAIIARLFLPDLARFREQLGEALASLGEAAYLKSLDEKLKIVCRGNGIGSFDFDFELNPYNLDPGSLLSPDEADKLIRFNVIIERGPLGHLLGQLDRMLNVYPVVA